MRTHPVSKAFATAAATQFMIACAPPLQRGVPSASGEAQLVSASDTLDAPGAACRSDSALTFADAEPSAAVDPSDSSHVVAAWVTRLGQGRAVIRAAWSFDRGAHWSAPVTLPITGCAGGPEADLVQASDPWIAIDRRGRIYVSAIAFLPGASDDSLDAAVVATSSDGGNHWTSRAAITASRLVDGKTLDNTSITADPVQPGVAYVLTTRYQPVETNRRS